MSQLRCLQNDLADEQVCYDYLPCRESDTSYVNRAKAMVQSRIKSIDTNELVEHIITNAAPGSMLLSEGRVCLPKEWFNVFIEHKGDTYVQTDRFSVDVPPDCQLMYKIDEFNPDRSQGCSDPCTMLLRVALYKNTSRTTPPTGDFIPCGGQSGCLYCGTGIHNEPICVDEPKIRRFCDYAIAKKRATMFDEERKVCVCSSGRQGLYCEFKADESSGLSRAASDSIDVEGKKKKSAPTMLGITLFLIVLGLFSIFLIALVRRASSKMHGTRRSSSRSHRERA